MVFIEHNTPSSKNSKQRTAKGFMVMSKTVTKFLRAHGIQSFSSSKKYVKGYKTVPMTFPVEELKWMLRGHEYPIVLGFHFVRGTRHRFDFNNVNQLLLDLLTAFDIIEDDDMNCIIPQCMKIEDKYYSYDKENPGCFISVIESN